MGSFGPDQMSNLNSAIARIVSIRFHMEAWGTKCQFECIRLTWVLLFQGYHVGTRELEEMGRFFCAGLLRVGRSYFYRNSNHGKANDSASESPTADSSW